MLGLGIGIGLSAGRGGSGFNPASLFVAGQPGHWSGGYDPAQGRLFQDAAGTIPDYLPGDPVGLVKRMAGTVDASQATALSRPTLARWPKGGRRNLLTWTEEFDNAFWTKSGVTVAANTTTAPDGTTTAEKVVVDGSSGFHRLNLPARNLPASPHTLSAYFKASEYTNAGLGLFDGSAFAARATFDLSNGTVSVTDGAATISAVGNGWYRCSVTGAASATTTPYLYVHSLFTYVGDSASGIFIWGTQLEVGSTATAYQRVTNQYDITEAGVPDVWHLSNDGGDSLPVTLPAGTYGRARVNAAGLVTVDTVVDPTNALVSNQQVDVILRQGAFTAEEEAKIRAYWARYVA